MILRLFTFLIPCIHYLFSLSPASAFMQPTPELRSRGNIVRRSLTVNILLVGKKNGAEQYIVDGCAEYEKRLSTSMNIFTTFLKTDKDLVEKANSLRGCVFALDENGKEYTSRDFSKAVYDGFEEGGSHVGFIIGGFSGLPIQVKNNFRLISLSKMPFTHQFARLLLLEQIYRAAEIHKGSGYHKD